MHALAGFHRVTTFELDERIVSYVACFAGRLVIGHALEHERVMPVACPATAGTKGLDDQQWFPQCFSKLNGALQGVVSGGSSKSGHPVEHEAALRIQCRFVRAGKPNRRDSHCM